MWGSDVGKRGEYAVFAHLVEGASGCTCASRDRPCKHALLLLAASDHPFKARPIPPAVLRAARAEEGA